MKAHNDSPTSKVVDGKKMRLTRKFLGNSNGRSTIEKNEFKAYLKGNTHFHYRKDEKGNPISYPVRQEYSYVN